MNDITTQRGRLVDLAARADGFAPLRRATGALVGTVYDGGSMPASLPGQFLVRPTAVAGAESEGNAGSLSAAGARSAVVTVVGTKVPVIGDVLVARRQGARWVAQLGGGGYTVTGHSYPGCPCVGLPDTIYMHGTGSAGGTDRFFYPASLDWRARPADVSVNGSALPDPGYYSSATFNDTNGLYKYRFYFSCFTAGVYVAGYVTTNDSPLPRTATGMATFLVGAGTAPNNNTCGPPLWLHLPDGTFNGFTITVDTAGPP